MAHLKLSDEDVAKLLSQAETTKHRQQIMHENAERWPSKPELELIAAAVRNEETEVHLTIGVPGKPGKTKLTEFKIDYIADRPNLIYISPNDPGQFAPCGVFDISRWANGE